jgi:Flp pilus assembly protein TadG
MVFCMRKALPPPPRPQRICPGLRRFAGDRNGSYAVEVALLLPLTLGIVMAVIEFGFIFTRDLTVKNYLGQMVQRIERGQADIDPVVTALAADSLMAGRNPQVCTALSPAACSGNSRLSAVTIGQTVTVGVTYNFIALTPVGNLLDIAFPPTLTRRETVTVGSLQNFTCPAGQVIQSITGHIPTCVPRDRNYTCSSGQVLEKIENGVAHCVTKAGTYTCGSGQVLRAIHANNATCTNRDADRDCPVGQAIRILSNIGRTCVNVDVSYRCSGDNVLQAVSGGYATCISKKDGTSSCPWNQVMYGVSNGVALCTPSPQNIPYGTMRGLCVYRHNHGHCDQAIWPALARDQCAEGYTWIHIAARHAGRNEYWVGECFKLF